MRLAPISSTTITLGDNGRALCGDHLGYTAKHSGYDLSGLKLMVVTPEIARQAQNEFGYIPSCESCGRKASLLVSA